MINMSAKFDKETRNGVVSIVFTRSTHGQTDGTTAALLYPHRNALRGDNNIEVHVRYLIISHTYILESDEVKKLRI